MPILNAGIAIGDRIEPTPEDMLILHRNLRRINRCYSQQPNDGRGLKAMEAFRNATHDYLHFSPPKKGK